MTETAGRWGSVTSQVGILGTISSASGKAAGETGITHALQGHPGRSVWSLPALWSYRGRPAGEEAGGLATPSEFPRVHLMTPRHERGRMTEVLSALIPSAVVAGAVVYGIVKLVRSDAAGLRTAREPREKSLDSEVPENPQS
ncbi:hypothetical protein GCM10010116_51980 [Microbispora rosea subsp. aerata]|nr:hypothetical protein GCM10010116_51980 [Microbispora rosea subsp. aerata]GIH58169.1 hypothetical protein Mro02_50830 [Microbispora rosea subsp. aerata]GLJ87057.1 hypothetical protein GCM10017588_58000 [Microbispora rosea subsp. aerata]